MYRRNFLMFACAQERERGVDAVAEDGQGEEERERAVEDEDEESTMRNGEGGTTREGKERERRKIFPFIIILHNLLLLFNLKNHV